MTRRRDMNERASRAAAKFEAYMARHRAHIEQATAAHQRRAEAMERRVARIRLTREQGMQAVERRVAELMAARGCRNPPGGRRRRSEEGGEAVPAVPKPKPNPLAGAAAAPIE